MSRIFSFHEIAEIEINEAGDFYDLESPGLGGIGINGMLLTIKVIF